MIALPLALWARARRLLTGQTHSSLAKRVAGTAFVIRLAGAALIYILQLLFARWMGAYEFGVYVYVWTWFLLVGTLAPLGLAYLAQRFIPEYRAKGQLAELRGFLFTGRLLCFGLGITAAVIGTAVIVIFQRNVTVVYMAPFLVSFACIPLLTMSNAQEFIATSFSWTGLALIPGYIVRPILMMALLAGLHVAGFTITALNALGALFVGLLITTVGQIPILGRQLSGEVRGGPRRSEVARWMRAALPLVLADSFEFLLAYIDVLLLKLFVGPEQIAYYYAATKIFSLLAIVLSAVAGACAHRFSEYYVTNNRVLLSQFAREATRMAFWPSLAVGVILLVCGRWILTLFGAGFDRAYPLLFILVVGALARASVGPAARLLTMVGKQTMCIVAYAAAVSWNIAFYFLLIPSLGLTGAAISTAGALVIESVVLWWGVKRDLGINVFIAAPSPDEIPSPELNTFSRAAVARLRALGRTNARLDAERQ